MKPFKFKGNTCSVKKFAEIIFETKNIKSSMLFNESDDENFLYGMIPKNWQHQKTIFEGKEVEAYYKGKLSKGKNEGLGTQIILENNGWGIEVISYYKGNWKNGKKNGKGFWSNVHPLVGTVNPLGDGDGYVYYAIDYENPGLYYKGNWLDDKRHGKGEEGVIYSSPKPEIVLSRKGLWQDAEFLK